MKKLLFLFVALPLASSAQLVTSSSTQLQVSEGTQMVIQTPNDIVNNSSSANFSNATLTINLIGGTQRITGDFKVSSLQTNANGSKTINNTVTVTNDLALNGGILIPASTGKLVFSGATDGISGGSNNSYCDGIFYSSGDGNRLFPVGTGGVYAPLLFESIKGETGVQVKNENSNLTFDGVEVINVDQDRYWLITTDPSLVNSKVTLNLNGLDAFNGGEGSTSVVQSSAVGGQAVNLGSSSLDGSSATSRLNVTAPILTLGKEKQVVVKVHDLITPFGSSGVNDQLFIENIDKFDHNKVTLLDRWGVPVKEWKNFSNEDPYDFSRLGPGSYICVVEYGNDNGPTQSIEQMVTVLKTN